MVTPPPLAVWTDRHATGGRPLLDVLRAAVDGGARWIVLREKDLPAPDRADLAARLAPLLSATGGTLSMAAPAAGDGLHLAATDAVPVPRPGLLGRSCHDRAEMAAAVADGVDYLTLSPVFGTPSKPGYGPPLGTARLRALAAGCPVPVYALGGVRPGNAAACLRAGAAGVAVMGAAMRAADPAALVAALLAELAAAAHTGTAP